MAFKSWGFITFFVILSQIYGQEIQEDLLPKLAPHLEFQKDWYDFSTKFIQDNFEQMTVEQTNEISEFTQDLDAIMHDAVKNITNLDNLQSTRNGSQVLKQMADDGRLTPEDMTTLKNVAAYLQQLYTKNTILIFDLQPSALNTTAEKFCDVFNVCKFTTILTTTTPTTSTSTTTTTTSTTPTSTTMIPTTTTLPEIISTDKDTTTTELLKTESITQEVTTENIETIATVTESNVENSTVSENPNLTGLPEDWQRNQNRQDVMNEANLEDNNETNEKNLDTTVVILTTTSTSTSTSTSTTTTTSSTSTKAKITKPEVPPDTEASKMNSASHIHLSLLVIGIMLSAVFL